MVAGDALRHLGRHPLVLGQDQARRPRPCDPPAAARHSPSSSSSR
jgi:hypothetical protein